MTALLIIGAVSGWMIAFTLMVYIELALVPRIRSGYECSPRYSSRDS